MSLPIEFSKDGIAYGVLYPMGPVQPPRWVISFYTSEKGRKRGISYLHDFRGVYCPIITFEVTLKEIRLKGTLIPAIPNEKHRDFVDVVKMEMKPRHNKIRDN